LAPLSGENWRSVVKEYSYTQLKKFSDKHRIYLSSRARAAEDIRVTLTFPDKKLKGIARFVSFKHFTYHVEPTGDFVEVDVKQALASIESAPMARTAKATFRIDYIPKPAAQ
jgi:hypothetical protein